ncbi:hypothetical protein F5B22DRAFT_152853 [Xylaria bambusicola]|uniref:uncharacterized protein n=1 Tax=Xylaria bambusicola TaxID=326684 RepID=UPI0020075059|nr:uncharacterized protein F5B22DRAFT_152853 [Xylaria bambusicola]KAI0526315.1 hypothetical protein F5B22DRAFT_152853 [Xylaria bambusicola]
MIHLVWYSIVSVQRALSKQVCTAPLDTIRYRQFDSQAHTTHPLPSLQNNSFMRAFTSDGYLWFSTDMMALRIARNDFSALSRARVSPDHWLRLPTWANGETEPGCPRGVFLLIELSKK